MSILELYDSHCQTGPLRDRSKAVVGTATTVPTFILAMLRPVCSFDCSLVKKLEQKHRKNEGGHCRDSAHHSAHHSAHPYFVEDLENHILL